MSALWLFMHCFIAGPGAIPGHSLARSAMQACRTLGPFWAAAAEARSAIEATAVMRTDFVVMNISKPGTEDGVFRRPVLQLIRAAMPDPSLFPPRR